MFEYGVCVPVCGCGCIPVYIPMCECVCIPVYYSVYLFVKCFGPSKGLKTVREVLAVYASPVNGVRCCVVGTPGRQEEDQRGDDCVRRC